MHHTNPDNSPDSPSAQVHEEDKSSGQVRQVAAANGGKLELGRHTLNFVYAPMVHWPEVMMTSSEMPGPWRPPGHQDTFPETGEYWPNGPAPYAVPPDNVGYQF